MAFQLQIPQPCTQNWDEMQANEQGRFCLHCQKTVIDFTEMTDTEIIHFFLHFSKEKEICGRMSKEQLAVSYPNPQLVPSSPWRRVVATLFASVLSLQTWAQNQQQIQQTPTEQLIFQTNEKAANNDYVLRGKVIHKTERYAIKNAQVVLKLNENETLGIYTNELGDFSFTFSLEKYPLQQVELAVMFGFETFMFAPKDFEGKYLMVCEIMGKEESITCIEKRRPAFRKECVSGTINIYTIAEEPSTSPSHYYEMKDQIRNTPTVYVKE
ncbi:MAG: hypothetical protein ACKVTZ_21100 [Bacteroidia bacterium]